MSQTQQLKSVRTHHHTVLVYELSFLRVAFAPDVLKHLSINFVNSSDSHWNAIVVTDDKPDLLGSLWRPNKVWLTSIFLSNSHFWNTSEADIFRALSILNKDICYVLVIHESLYWMIEMCFRLCHCEFESAILMLKIRTKERRELKFGGRHVNLCWIIFGFRQ